MEWQWVLLSVPSLQMHLYAIMKKEWLDNCLIRFKPMIYKRHVDDNFVPFYHLKNTYNFL